MTNIQIIKVVTYEDSVGNSFVTEEEAIISELKTKASDIIICGTESDDHDTWVDRDNSLTTLVEYSQSIKDIVEAYNETVQEMQRKAELNSKIS